MSIPFEKYTEKHFGQAFLESHVESGHIISWKVGWDSVSSVVHINSFIAEEMQWKFWKESSVGKESSFLCCSPRTEYQLQAYRRTT